MITIVARRALPLMACVALAAPAGASTEDEVRSTFERFVQVQNAHDAKALAGLLADSPDFLWITRGNVIWGREAALQRFSKLYEGTWQLEPEASTLKVVRLGADTAQLHVAVNFRIGAVGQPPQTTRVFLNQVLVKADGTWRVASIFPVPAPSP